jgi:hypothetical protein
MSIKTVNRFKHIFFFFFGGGGQEGKKSQLVESLAGAS